MVSLLVGDIVAICELCERLAAFVEDVKRAPTEYQSQVHRLNSMHSAFKCIADEVQICSEADASALIGGDTEIFRRLSSEIAVVRTTLEEVEGILIQRYAESANSHCLHALRRRVRWGSTRSKVDKCLNDIRQPVDCILILMGTGQMKLIPKLISKVNECAAAFHVHRNERPPAIGLPGSGGAPQDHIRLRYGLGSETFLPIDPFSDRQRLKEFLAIMFVDWPGKQHIAKQYYKFYCDTNSHEPQELTKERWPHLVTSGCTILLAFVVGTSQMNCINFCPGCERRNGGGWKTWQDCPCGCLYFVSEAGEVEYEPRDGFWCGEAKELKNWKDSKSVKRQEQMFGPIRAETVMDPTAAQIAGNIEGGSTDDFDRHSEDELYFRCMIMVYDPIWNFVCRNVFCRCILGETSSTSKAPQIDIMSSLPCPNHARAGVRPNFDAISRTSLDDCKEDPYFNNFGGYENFKQIARYLNENTIALAFVDMDKLCPRPVQDDELVLDLIDTHADAVSQYQTDVLFKLDWHWQNHMRTSYEKLDPEFVTSVETWFLNVQHDLANKVSSAETDEKESHRVLSPWPGGWDMVPCLWKGRLTLETLKDLKNIGQYVCALP